MNTLLTANELDAWYRKWVFKYNVENGWHNPMFIEYQHNYERAEFDIF